MSAKKLPLTLEQRVLEYIHEKGLLEAGQKVLVAVSGGPDSVGLLYILHQIQTGLKIDLHIAHLNHQLRGQESAADEQYVSELADRLGISATIERRDVAGYQAEHRLSLEEAARELRYGFLARVAEEIGAERVAVGHTQNDQAETILLHIIRGTGTRGLRGLEPIHTMRFSGKKLTVVRPLLEVRHQETEDYCARHKLAPCRDSSNFSLNLLRNRVRHELLPLLQDYNPGVLDSLLRIGRIAKDDLAWLDAESEKAWSKVISRVKVTHDQSPVLVLDKEKFQNLAPALQRHLLRQAIGELLGTLKDIEVRHIEEVLTALDKPAGRRITLPEGLIFSIEYDRYLLGFHPEGLTPYPELQGTHVITVPGVTKIPGWEIEVTVQIQNSKFERQKLKSKVKSEEIISPVAWPGTQSSERRNDEYSRRGGYASSPEAIDSRGGRNDSLNEGVEPGTGKFTECFDFAKTGSTIKIRAREPGDWFQPLGMEQPEKVGRFMVNARIPRSWRPKIPIFYTSEHIIWVAGWRMDDRVKVTEETRQILCLRMVRINEWGGKSRENQ